MHERSCPMKSMLHEASSIIKAIQKAWELSGKPESFSVKVLEKGEKGLFGFFTKRPAIVSITYDNKPITNTRSNNRPTHADNKEAQRQTIQRKEKDKPSNNNIRQLDPQRNKSNTSASSINTSMHQQSQKDAIAQEQAMWTPELASNITQWLTELVSVIDASNVNFTSRIEGKSLHITFEKPVIAQRDAERSLFISFAYLLIQALKKKCKKKLRGFHLVITSK